jgi:hypothetical protein
LHKFVSGDEDLTDAEIREELKSEGVNVEAFLSQLGKQVEMKGKPPSTKQPTAAE